MCFIYKPGYDFLCTRDKVTILLKGWYNLQKEKEFHNNSHNNNNEILEKKIRLTYSSTKTFMRGQSTTTNKRKEEKSPVSISAINQWIWCGILHEIECKKKKTNGYQPPMSTHIPFISHVLDYLSKRFFVWCLII